MVEEKELQDEMEALDAMDAQDEKDAQAEMDGELEESFEELLKDYEQGGFELKRNDVVEGTIVQVNPDSVVVDVGYKSEGVIPLREFADENGEINVKEFVEALGTSSLYIREFYTPYPNTKVIELGTKHFLGRAPLNQAEIRKYNEILASQGLKAFIGAMVNGMEYAQVFGEDTVPYRRFPTLPAANFPNTERLYNQLTKQNDELVVPSFEPVAATDRS